MSKPHMSIGVFLSISKNSVVTASDVFQWTNDEAGTKQNQKSEENLDRQLHQPKYAEIYRPYVALYPKKGSQEGEDFPHGPDCVNKSPAAVVLKMLHFTFTQQQ